MNRAINDSLQEILDKRKEQSLYRSLQIQQGLTDFCSNDYLSFARYGDMHNTPEEVDKLKQAISEILL